MLMYPGRPLSTLSGAASPTISRRVGVWCGLQPYLRAISIRVYLSIAPQSHSAPRTPRSRWGIVTHLRVETQCCWCSETNDLMRRSGQIKDDEPAIRETLRQTSEIPRLV